MLGIRLEPELARRLDWLARATGRPKSDLAREAIRIISTAISTRHAGSPSWRAEL